MLFLPLDEVVKGVRIIIVVFTSNYKLKLVYFLLKKILTYKNFNISRLNQM